MTTQFIRSKIKSDVIKIFYIGNKDALSSQATSTRYKYNVEKLESYFRYNVNYLHVLYPTFVAR